MSKQGVETGCLPSLTHEALDPDRAADLALMFKALGDPVRLRLLSLVASGEGGEVCVCDLTSAFALSQPTISHHLKVLREARVLECERRGSWVHYRVVPGALARLADVIAPAEVGAVNAR